MIKNLIGDNIRRILAYQQKNLVKLECHIRK